MTLVPAYGRDYNSKAEVIADYEAGHDFRIADVSSSWHGSYCSKDDFIGVVVKLRYDKLTKAVLHTAIEEDMISNAATEMALTSDEAKSICKLGQLENCCAFLVTGSNGFLCIRLDPFFAEIIHKRLKNGAMNAKGEGGWPGCLCEEELEND